MKGLIGWWQLKGNTVDSTGQNSAGVVNGATLTADRFGTNSHAYAFGAGKYIDCGNSTNLNIGSTFSVSAWFYPTSTTHYQPIVAKMPDATVGWEVANSNGLWRVTLRNTPVNISTGTITLSVWHLLTATYDGTTLTLYADGAFLASTTGSATLDSTTNLLIGRRGLDTSYFDGSIGEVRLYNRALSALEVTALYKSSGPDFAALF